MNLLHLQTVPVLVEACCDSVATAQAAQSFGAGRIELCGAGDGGTTPPPALVAECLSSLVVPVQIMIRPHTRDFCYSDADVAVMFESITIARSLGAYGVVVGPLNADHTVHVAQTTLLVQAARPMSVTFHRAFDQTPDAFDALDTLLALGVDRILTSGHAATALAGADTLRDLQARAGTALTIMAGGGVRGSNVRELVQRSRLREVHARSTDPVIVHDVVKALLPE